MAGQGRLLELEIDGVGTDGLGVGHVDGRAVFVARVALGERIRARVVHVGSRRIVAELIEVLAPSPDRVAPACPAFGRCGGCQLQHLRYEAQLRWKAAVLAEALRSIAGVELPPAAPLPSAPLGYRNRGQYPVGRKGDRVVTGFFEARSHALVPVERCGLHQPAVDEAVSLVRLWAGRERVSIYDEALHRGWLRHVVVRRSEADGQVLVALVVTRPRASGFDELVRLLEQRVPGFAGLVLNQNPAATNVILGRESRVLWGQGSIVERLDGLAFELSVGSFFQVNTPQAGRLFAAVREFLAGVAGPIVDAYCGVGVLAQLLARPGRPVIGIEVASQAVRDARRSAERNGIALELYAEPVERALPRLVGAGLRPGAVVLDPPRKGCDPEVLAAVAQSGAERVAYVSCHPGTLARDLRRLHDLGFRLELLQPVDMFPQTAHLETFAGLVR